MSRNEGSVAMCVSISVSNSDGSDRGESLEQRARLAEQMVHDLEEFLGAALAAPINGDGHNRWPLRYNSKTGKVTDQAATKG